MALDMYPAAHGYSYQNSFLVTGMKPILKHGPVTDGDGAGGVEEEEENEEKSAGRVVFRLWRFG